MNENFVRFTCPCCGYRTLLGSPGSYGICKVCYWEDDHVQLLDPSYRGGANGPSLIECQANYARVGASEECFLGSVRPPQSSEICDPEWRPARQSDVGRIQVRDLATTHELPLEIWYYWKNDPK